MSGYPGAGFDANTATLVGAQSYVANRDGSRYIGINGDNNAEIGIAGNAWVFSSDSSIRFPDYTVQRTAYELRGLPPLTAWGTAYPTGGESTLDYQFYFDGSSGFPSMVSYSSAGGYPVYNTIWSAESLTSGAPAYSTNGPYNVVNTDQTTILGATLQPGEYVIARIQNLTTGKVFRVTFMGSFNVGDEGNEHKYGSIIVERLL